MKWTTKLLPDGYWWAGVEVRGTWKPVLRVDRAGNCLRF